MEEDIKMFLFGRWMSTCYSSNEMNTSDGYWWKERLKHFNKVVYPNYVKNGSVADAKEFFKTSETIGGVIGCITYVGVLNEPHAKCEKCGRGEWEHEI